VVTIAILGLLASVALPYAQLARQRSQESELRENLRQIRTAIDAYRQAVQEKRIESPADASGYPPSLDKLWQGVPDITRPDHARIYFLRRLPRDPFYPDQSRPPEDTWGQRSYQSPPDSPQEGDDVFDVYSLSPKTGLNGVPYREW
jgi:general secretion pathway protein G